MTTVSIPHEQRTAQEPRQNTLYKVRLSKITNANPTVRLLRLAVGSALSSEQEGDCKSNNPAQLAPFHFLPGQWLDVHVPSVERAGGFTITSTPQDAQQLSLESNEKEPYVELAIQDSPSSPPAAWLWRPENEILGQELGVRVGGSFTWPPPDTPPEEIERAVFVAGGVGINPLISMLSHIFQNPSTLPHSPPIHLLYSTRLPTTPTQGEDISNHLNQVLFLPRLRNIMKFQQQQNQALRLHLHIFITNLPKTPCNPPPDFALHDRRITMADLRDVVCGRKDAAKSGGGPSGDRTVCYVCGPPNMTDEFVAGIEGLLGPAEKGRGKRVFCEKWW
ncbi:hypothetical protein AJ79_04768 [Helicocarpus griseus UAMH5409]|uniref:FAD-binding FR-type domain-containing protein n=1 Tax=Helicocarpus griseus UAMH5409 TaxID=1447875 RepID=A0A2B7XSQ1_9EURO|nr:hypothetical protein AJ79_04768 [Helicocarpus griseus UAMH5409]